jgi:predicted DCC family thiol-disulfide oxidoreductase YuxK
LLYDGVCGLCHRSVRWLLAHEASGDASLRFAPLQGETARELRRQFRQIPDELSTVVYVDHGRCYLRSKAFLQASRHLRWPWRLGYHLRWLPGPIVDLAYRLVARVRYRLWGKLAACDLPASGQATRFLA